jgi:hypothetical protein
MGVKLGLTHEGKVLITIFGPKREEGMGGLRRLDNEELHNLHASLNIIRVMKSRRLRWVGHGACMGQMRNVYKILVRKPEAKRPLRRPRHRWEDNIKMELRETGREDVEWINLAQNRSQWWALMNTVMNLLVLQKA